MIVEMVKSSDVTHVYLEHLKKYPGTCFILALSTCYLVSTVHLTNVIVILNS
jgi:hypothetical protein